MIAKFGFYSVFSSLYHLNLIKKLNEEISKQIENSTDNPYESLEVNINQSHTHPKLGAQKQYFFDNSAQESAKRPKSDTGGNNCWFCLTNPNIEKHLIIYEGTNVIK